MKNISDNISSLKGLYIKNCFRIFSESDYESIPDDLREQESDGSTFLIFSDESVYGFFPNTEKFTIELEKLHIKDIPNNSYDVSKNVFWSSVIGIKITSIKQLYSNLNIHYGFRFFFENNTIIDIKYISESVYTFDALVIRKPDGDMV